MNDPKGKSRLFLNDNKTDKTERKKSDKTEEEENVQRVWKKWVGKTREAI